MQKRVLAADVLVGDRYCWENSARKLKWPELHSSKIREITRLEHSVKICLHGWYVLKDPHALVLVDRPVELLRQDAHNLVTALSNGATE